MRLFKWLTVPKTNETTEVEVAQLWYVQWTSRHGPFSSETRDVMEAFVDESAANTFAESLRKAFKLIKHTSGTRVTVEKN